MSLPCVVLIVAVLNVGLGYFLAVALGHASVEASGTADGAALWEEGWGSCRNEITTQLIERAAAYEATLRHLHQVHQESLGAAKPRAAAATLKTAQKVIADWDAAAEQGGLRLLDLLRSEPEAKHAASHCEHALLEMQVQDTTSLAALQAATASGCHPQADHAFGQLLDAARSFQAQLRQLASDEVESHVVHRRS